MNHESARVAIPVDKCYGWWKVPDEAKVEAIESSLLPKGTREQNLVINIRRGIEAVLESTKKVAAEEINFLEEEPDYGDEEENARRKGERSEVLPGVTAPDAPGSWSQEVALRSEKYLLEQVEALVDSLSFRPSCLSTEGDGDKRLNPVTVAKQRLLELENAIERRYLKAPLGQTKDATLQHITEKERQADKDESMDVDDEEEEEEEEEVKENGVDKNGKPDEEANKSEDTNGEGEEKDEEKKEEDKKEKKKSGPPAG